MEEERAARETGAWTFLTHRAFPQFDPAVHIIPPQGPPPGHKLLLAIDPAHRRPFALLWAAFGPHGDILVYNEWPKTSHHEMRSSTNTVAEYIDIVVREEGLRKADFRILDPRFGQQHGTIKAERLTSIQEDFAAREKRWHHLLPLLRVEWQVGSFHAVRSRL